MNTLAAARLAQRIANGWPRPSTITADEWAAELVDLDDNHADATFVRMRRERTYPPSIAEFHRAYHATHPTRPRHDPRGQRCSTCDGTGWVETDALDVAGQLYSQAEPCDCTDGLQARETLARIEASRPPIRAHHRATQTPLSAIPLPPLPDMEPAP